MDAARPTCLPAISLVMPAYNEAAVIVTAVTEAVAALTRDFAEYELIVVDDGSCDDTAEAVSGLLPDHPRLRLVRHPANRGYGAALRTGFEAARFGLVAFTDADAQFDLSDLARLAAFTESAPIVAGYRADRRDPWRRKVLSKGYNLLTRALLGTRVRDCDCALKVFRRGVLAELLPRSRGFFVNAEMLTRARQLGHAVVEVAVTHRPRRGGWSKVSLLEVPRTLKTLAKFWWSDIAFGPRPRRFEPLRVVIAGRMEAALFQPAPEPPPSSTPARPVGLPAPRRVPA